MEILKQLIVDRRLTRKKQSDIALYLGITTATLNRYETGKREIPFNVLLKYAEYFDYEVRLLKKT